MAMRKAMRKAMPKTRDPLPDPEAFAADFRLLVEAPPVEGLIRPLHAWYVMSALQLALCHPEFPDSLRGPVEAFARQLQAIVSVTPLLASVAEASWQRDQDVAGERGSG